MDSDYSAVSLIAGVPGIGKSIFLIYFIYRYLRDNKFGNKKFALQFTAGIYHCFSPSSTTSTLEYTVHDESWMLYNLTDFLLLCDMKAYSEPAICTKWTFIFSSPDPRRYKQKLKNEPSFLYTMPTWSFTELKNLNDDIDSWIDNYIKKKHSISAQNMVK